MKNPATQDSGPALASALELLIRQGYNSTPVEELADAAGISRSTFFRKYGDERHWASWAARWDSLWTFGGTRFPPVGHNSRRLPRTNHEYAEYPTKPSRPEFIILAFGISNLLDCSC